MNIPEGRGEFFCLSFQSGAEDLKQDLLIYANYTLNYRIFKITKIERNGKADFENNTREYCNS